MATGLTWQGRIVEHFRGGMGYHQLRELPIAADHDHSQGGGQDGMPGGHVSGQSHDGIGALAEGQQKGWVRWPSWRAALVVVLLVVGLAVVGVGVFLSLSVSENGVKGVCFLLV